ncbi:MAG: hypothetical protein LQ339_002365 [Xanthoria mediterranea]|nr:MAG: hypothetical protein LQ339_002365 [Xanthoria mediterranea]
MDIHKQEFTVRELPTRTVTLYPSRAHVVRTIGGLSLKPGLNEITVYGITPTADDGSITFEGTGSATIADMTVDLVDNREHFEDVYPSDSEGAEDSDGGVISDSETKSQAVKDLTTQLQQLEMATREATEQRNSAQGRLNMLDNYARSLITSRPEDIATCVTAYQNERAKAFEDHKTGEARMKEHDQQISKVKIKKRKLQLKLQKEQARANRAKTKEQERKHRIHQQNVSEKNRVRQERMRFWPKKVWKVVLSLETHANTTPTSSRRESIESMAKSLKPVTRNAPEGSDVDTSMIKLSFSYIVHSASWSPRYDLALDTRTKSGSITYRAEFRNTTSETWRDASVILSTSQTSFQGLGDSIPKIQPWHIRLAKGFGDVGNVDEALYSRHEHNPQHRSQGGVFGAQQPMPAPPPATQHAGTSNSLFGGSAQATSSGFGGVGRGGDPFEFSNPISHSQGGSLFGSHARSSAPDGAFQVQPNIAAPAFQQARIPLADEDEADIDDNTIAATEGALAFEESIWEESGLTTTYGVPGLKTIAPSNTTRRHKVASIPLSSVTLSHILVPKIRTAAFLKARLRNSSSITLLKGLAGISIDGTFLGNTSLPRSSPGEAFVLNLGVDPGLNVVYSKPMLKRRSDSGVFQKEGCAIYTRTCTLTNTKNHATIDATVVDQVPVSEDDKLKIDILNPKGLGKEGSPAVKTGEGQINDGTGKKGSTYAEESSTGSSHGGGKWGNATAKMKKEGEIEWEVKLNPGQGVILTLEYSASFPSGTGIVDV